jgi:Mce-associated membrane protein
VTEHPAIEDAEKAEDTEKAEESAHPHEQVRRSPLKRLAARGAWVQRVPGRWVWAASVVASVALVAALFVFMYRPLSQTGDDAAKSAVTAATEGTAAVYSYASDTIDRDVAAAKSHLTGDFLTQYEKDSATGAVAAAKSKAVRTTGVVTGAAVKQLRPDSADVLVFLNLTSATEDAPATQLTAGSLVVTLAKVDGKWLISAMKPV